MNKPKNTHSTYKKVGIVFVIASLVAIAFGQMSMFATWLPIGAAFFAIGNADKKS